MNKQKALFLFIILLITVLAGCAGQNENGYQNIDAAQLKAMMESGNNPVLVDVREPDEFSSGYLPGAVNIPLGDIESRARELPQNSALVLYCRSGRRSAAAADILNRQGFNNIYNLSGGILKWPDDLVK